MTCPQRDTHCSKRKMDKRSITSAGIHCGVQVKKKMLKFYYLNCWVYAY